MTDLTTIRHPSGEYCAKLCSDPDCYGFLGVLYPADRDEAIGSLRIINDFHMHHVEDGVPDGVVEWLKDLVERQAHAHKMAQGGSK